MISWNGQHATSNTGIAAAGRPDDRPDRARQSRREHGAIRIYRSQIRLARLLWPDVVAALEDILEHEVRHCAVFLAAMPARGSRPCRVMSLWGVGGSALGTLTALMGRQGIWICTAAVEAAVHRHLDDQLLFLVGKDSELHAAIMDIREEELAHLSHAQAQLPRPGGAARVLRAQISILTDILIWLSTWGDSARMASALRRQRPA
jgi:ubiquinone biosynthesis monooxygenase Coq7